MYSDDSVRPGTYSEVPEGEMPSARYDGLSFLSVRLATDVFRTKRSSLPHTRLRPYLVESWHRAHGLVCAGVYMVAGAVAGVAEHTAMYPLDTIKTRAQALAHPGQQLHGATLWRALQTAVRHEGWLGLYRGIGAMVGGAGPAHAVYFLSYETAKKLYGADQPGHQVLATGLAGASATIIQDACMTPADVVKQRLQLVNTPYRNVYDCVYQTFKQEGIWAFYRSYRTTLLMNIPFMAVQVTLYESCKKLMGSEEEDGLAIQLVAGAVAGGTAAGVTTPLDVVKTRLQTQGVTSSTTYTRSAVIPTMRQIVREEGRYALWRGWKPRVLFHMPAAAICWGTYETMKLILGSANGNGKASP